MRAKQHKSTKPLNKTRKQLRKEMRKQKKVRRNEYFTSRKKNGIQSTNNSKSSPNFATHQIEDVEKIPKTSKSDLNKDITVQNNKKQKLDKVLTQGDQLQKALLKEKKEHEKLQKEMAKRRREAFQIANEEEDRNIKRLEKQLNLNKRKSKTTPKSFAADGLDYLLEMCDSDNMKAVVAAEQQLNEVNDDFEEDFALMTGKRLKKENSDQEDGISDIDMEDTMDIDQESELSGQDDANSSDAYSDEEDDTTNHQKNSVSLVNKKEQNRNARIDSEDDNNDNIDNIDGDEFAGSDDIESDDDNIVDQTMENDNDIGSNTSDRSAVDDDDEENIKKDNEVWEDIYGRLRKKDGTVIKENENKYIPPAIRAKLEAESSGDKKRDEKLNRLRKQIKGLLNRLAESNMHNIASQVENLYMNNSRNDMNDTLTSLIFDSVVTPVLTPERLLLEHVMLVTILHANIGTEVGAHFLQTVVRKFDELYNAELPVENKMLDNVVWVIAQLYNFKVFHVQLIYEILNKLSERFNETDIECILLILKNVGFSLRKDDAIALKNLILSLQKQASNASSALKDNPRVKFMLDILLAVKNNNMSKIPNYDTSYSEHLKKLLKGLIRKGYYVTTLNISLEDLLKADECGKWWVVGSAWSGKTTESDLNKNSSNNLESFSEKLLSLARKQRMNTDTRRNIFCIIMSAEDYMDAFERLLHLDLKNQQEREIIHVILHCCLQETAFNPYYAVLAQKLCEHDRKFQMTIKYSVWDKLKTVTECSSTQLSNLAKLLTHLFLEKGLPISTLKIVQFSELDKITLRFIRQILIGILLHEDDEVCQGVFTNVAQSEKLKMFRESLKLFIQHFLLRNLKTEAIPEEQKQLLENRAKIIDKILSVNDKKIRF